MKFSKVCVTIILTGFVLDSCIKEEAPNAECDIEKAYVKVNNPSTLFYSLADTAVNILSTDSTVTFSVRRTADLSAVSPMFELTKGATISPASGSVHDFSKNPVIYTVTSQDKAWNRIYKVAFNKVIRTVNDTICYDFEHYSLEPSGQKYYVWQHEEEDGTLSNIWATANAGFGLSMSTAKPEDYPTVPVTDGYEGSAVKLTTCSTGPFGVIANRRLAAGNMYLGSFDLSSALTNTLHATHFGVVCDREPVRFTGYYKYAPGSKFQDKNGNILANKTDSASVYAVFYRNQDADGNAITLYGDNIKTSPQIIAIADCGYLKPTDKWAKFDVTFNYQSDIDADLLLNRGYNLAVVFSSSKEGDQYSGAIGSMLHIDKVKVICTKEQ